MARRRGAWGGTGIHLTFGDDPATSMVVSWLTDEPADREVRCSPAEAGENSGERVVPAVTRAYRDAEGNEILVQHATLDGLCPGTRYRYAVSPALGAGEPDGGEFSTAPAPGPEVPPFTFTCFGDHGTDNPEDPYGSPASAAVVAAVDAVNPLFNMVLGDLSYASLRSDPPLAWEDWFRMISPSARNRPWMPAVGNHETERAVGRFGLDSYQAYFDLPANGAGDDYEGLWYAFTVGRARFVVVTAEDVCYQEHGLVVLRDFSKGEQTAWLEQTLRAAREDPAIDWLIVGMHQVAMSTAAHHNGGDLLLREQWLPIFDRYGVDLVLCGHEHHYERTLPVRGVVPGSKTLVPRPAQATTALGERAQASALRPGAAAETAVLAPEAVDTTTGTVHLVIGTGGSSTPSADALLDPPAGRVVVQTEKSKRHRRTTWAVEEAPWLAARSTEHPYAFAELAVDAGTPGGLTTIRLTIRDSTAPLGAPPIDEVVLVRPRADADPAG